MLNHRDIIKKILSFRPELTENDLQSIIQKKRERAGYLLTEEGAIYLLANELGIDLSNGRVARTDVRIRDLIVGANDATVIGRISAVSPIKTFRRKDGVEGKVARLVISDETGKISVVLWNEKTSKLEAEEAKCVACGNQRETVQEEGPIELPWFKAENARNYNNKTIKKFDYDREAVEDESKPTTLSQASIREAAKRN